MKVENINNLMQRLQHIGFPRELEYYLRFYALFGPEQFQITWRQVKEGNSFKVVVCFKKEERGYQCLYYDAILQKMEELPDAIRQITEVKELDEQMQSISWERVQFETFKENAVDHAELLNSIQSIVEGLNTLKTTEEGNSVASRLKLKYWSDTPVEVFITDLNSLKAGMEISQRYYFFEEGAQITLDEAYRFLCHRWKEKQLKSAKKQTAPIESAVQNGKDLKKGAKGRKAKAERQGIR